MDIRRSRTCERCKNSIPLSQVRLYPKGQESNVLVCEDCCNKLKLNVKEQDKKPIRNSLKDMVYMNCIRCKYNFKIDKMKAGVIHKIVCPYCGKNDKIKEHVGHQESLKRT